MDLLFRVLQHLENPPGYGLVMEILSLFCLKSHDFTKKYPLFHLKGPQFCKKRSTIFPKRSTFCPKEPPSRSFWLRVCIMNCTIHGSFPSGNPLPHPQLQGEIAEFTNQMIGALPMLRLTFYKFVSRWRYK